MKAFVAMPFAAAFDAHWSIIEKVCKQYKIEVFRVDRHLSFERHIDIAIRREIRQSDFMIALLTGDKDKKIPNPNVAFEVGYAQGIGLETILLAEEVDHLPFDFQQQRTCIYESDMEKFESGLNREVKLLKEMISKSFNKRIKSFFSEITRCLRITLPSSYKLFGEEKGYFDENIWYSIYFNENKRNFRYTVYLKTPEKVTISCWLSNKEYRGQQKEFLQQHNEVIRKRLGYDLYIRFKESTNYFTREISNKELTREILELENPGTKEALDIALKLTNYVEVFEPFQYIVKNLKFGFD